MSTYIISDVEDKTRVNNRHFLRLFIS